MLDQPVGLRLRDRVGATTTFPRSSNSNSGSVDSSVERRPRRRAAPRARRQPPARPRAPAPQRSPPRGPSGEDAVDLGRSRAARRSGSPSGRTRCCERGTVEHDLDRDREAILARDQRARVVRQRLRAASARPRPGRTRSSRAGTPRGRRASAGGTYAETSAMCTHTRRLPSSSPTARDRVVEVARAGRVDREASAASADRDGRAGDASPATAREHGVRARLVVHRGVEPTPQARDRPSGLRSRRARRRSDRAGARPSPARRPDRSGASRPGRRRDRRPHSRGRG